MMQEIDMPEEIARNILEAESSDGLFDISVRGIRLYQHIRMRLYYEVTEQMDIFDPGANTSRPEQIKSLFSYIRHAVTQNEMWGLRKSKVVIVENPRHDPETGRNIHTYFLLENFRHDYSVIRLSDADPRYPRERGKNYKLFFYDYFAIKRKLFMSFYMRKRIGAELNDVAKIISNSTKNHLSCVPLGLHRFILSSLLRAYIGVRNSVVFLRNLNPDLLIVVNSYGHTDIVHGARILRIPVIELQHGFIYPYHLGYTYPNVEKGFIDIFPDYLFTFGELWNSATTFPVHKQNLIATGFPYFEEQRKKYQNLDRKKRDILFISQNTIGRRLLRIAIQVAQRALNYTIIFKLHPKQYRNWETRFGDILCKMPSNVVIYGEDTPNIYRLFRTSRVQVGVFSTALYEGLGFGLKTIICMLPGWRFAEHLVSSKQASLAKNSKDILRLISIEDDKKSDVDKIFRPNAVNNIHAAIDEILEQRKKTEGAL